MTEKFKPGWLARQMHAAHISLIAGHSPSFFFNGPIDIAVPISNADAADVFAVLDARFSAWTGRSLEEHIKRNADQ